jgi:hypothetical protein
MTDPLIIELEEELRRTDETRADLVDVLLTIVSRECDRRPVISIELGRMVLGALDAERERTDVDEWDESDPRCALYNAAYELSQ